MKQVGPGYHVDDGRTLVENQQDGGENGERAIEEDENGKLGDVGEEEHAGDDGHGEDEIGAQAREQRPPERPVEGEIDDAL